MTKDAQAKIIEKLKHLNQAVSELEEFQSLAPEDFVHDKRNEYTVERLFQIALEAALDIARLTIIDRQLAKPGETRNEFQILAAADILPSDLSQRLSEAKKFRNVLVHEYVGVDPQKVQQHLQDDLGDLVKFAQEISKGLL